MIAEDIFVGHGTELHRLLNLYEQVCNGKGQIVLISGKPGCGKSALARMFAQKAAAISKCSTISFNCRCASTELSYSMLFHTLTGHKPDKEQRDSLANLTPDEAADFFYKYLQESAAKNPTIIIADDFQYCNPDIYSMIYALAQHIVDGPCNIMAVAAYNMADPAIKSDPLINRISRDLFPIKIGSITQAWKTGGFCELVPEPLKLSDTADLISTMFPGNEFPSDTANIIHSATQGNPAFMNGLLNYMLQNGDIKQIDNGWIIVNLDFYSNARHLQNVVTKPVANHKYRYTAIKETQKGNPNELINKTIEAVQKTSMPEAVQLADKTWNALAYCRSSQVVWEYRATSLQAKYLALSWLGYHKEALECGTAVLGCSKRMDNKYYLVAGYFFVGQEYMYLADHDKAVKYIQKSIDYIKGNPKHPALADGYYALGKVYLTRSNHTSADYFLNLALKGYTEQAKDDKIALVKIDLATLKRSDKDNAGAYQLLNEVIDYCTKAVKPHILAKAYINLGLSYDNDSRFAEAKRYYTEALRLCFHTGDRINLANCYNNMGLSKNAQSKYTEALTYFHKALEIDRMLGNTAKISISYNNIGLALLNSGDENGAEKYFNAALENDSNAPNKYGIAVTYSNLGALYSQKSETDTALRYYKLALKEDHANNDIAGMIADYNAIGNLHYGSDNIQGAMQYFNKSLELSQQSNDEAGRAAVYNNIGNIFYSKQDYERASQYYLEALKINNKLNDNAAAALNYSNLASVYEEQKKTARAETYYDNAIELYHKVKYKAQEAYNLTSLATLYYRSDRFNKAKVTYLLAAKIYKNIGDTKEYIRSLSFAGDTMRMLCEYKEAQKALDEAIELSRNLGDLHSEALATGTLACMYAEMPDAPRASEYYKRAIELYRSDNDLDMFAEMLSALAYLYNENGDTDEALICQHQVIETYRLTGNTEQLAAAYAETGLFYENGNYEKSAENYILSAQHYQVADRPGRQADALIHAADALMHTQNRDQGYECLTSAVDILQTMKKEHGDEVSETDINDKLVQAFTAIADYFFENKDYLVAVANYTTALDISSKTEAHTRTAYICNNIGYTYDTFGIYTRALEYYNKACEEYDKEEFKSEGLFNNLKNVALMHERLGNNLRAAEYYRKAFDTFENEFHIEISSLADCALSAATAIFGINGDIETANKYYHKAYSLFKKDDNHTGIIKTLLSRAVSNAIVKRYDEATSLASQIMHVFDISSDIDTKCTALRATAQINIKLGKLDEAVKKYQQALDLLFARDLWDAAAQLYYNMATQFAENCGKMAATIDFNGKTLTMYDFISKLLSNTVDLAKTEKDTDLEIQAIVSQARYNISCDEKDLALGYLRRAVDTAAATGSAHTEASVLLEKADILMRFYKDFNTSALSIDRAIVMLKSTNGDKSLLSYAYALKFVQLVYQNQIDEAKVVYQNYAPHFYGYFDTIPMLRNAVNEFSTYLGLQ
ncbi:MAG: tetratricopeptide repeat protein [Bacteroidales bacterium]|nr:tetratricopeptide repeat protein [Bacteroidales bacterium]